MARVAVVTDSNSGIFEEEGKRLGVAVAPMPVHIDHQIFYEGVDLFQEQFYESMRQGADVATSQPAPGDVMGLWEQVLEEYDELVYIPMTAGLSSSCQTAISIAEEYGGRVQVVDNRRISVTQKASVMDALRLAKEGRSALEIKEILEKEAMDACIYITVDNLKYLRKGGRVSGVEAIAGTMLNIKPVLEIYGEKLNAVDKVRGMKAARQNMIQRVKQDLNGRLKDLYEAGEVNVLIAYSQVSDEVLEGWKAEVLEAFQDEVEIHGEPLTLCIACHTGPGALGVGAVRKYW